MKPLSPAHNKLMVSLLANLAVNSGDVRQFYIDTVLQLHLPPTVQNARIGAVRGNPEPDARNLLKWATDFGTNPNDNVPTLGALANLMLESSGVEDAVFLASVIRRYQLLPPGELAALARRFQIPRGLAGLDTAPAGPIGPQFDWVAPTDQAKLESWLFPVEPELLEVSILQNAVNRARSVCRVEIPSIGENGTGVLVGEGLILTNYHVLTKRPEDLLLNAKSTILRFGAFTAAVDSPEGGQVMRLDAANPVVEASPTKELDFVLLRTDGTKAKDVVVAPIESGALPLPDSAIHLLQHPRAGPMMLALSKNGVTEVNAGNGKIRYVTRSAGGSSGSPCFNEAWKLIALHHAEIPQAFGSVREGILIKTILGRINQFLS